ncbi:MAG: YeeE/YedE family protein [Planctomycetes bacterium]|nr:YeeE/YedE family protein [Planctomycetota bacterium]
MHDAFFVRPWPFWIAGFAIGLFVPLFALCTGKALGISSGYTEVCSLSKPAGAERWKLWFVLGLPLGGFLARIGAADFEWATSVGSDPMFVELALFAVGGVLIGWGARKAGGCTSGHSIVGIALGARASVIATIGFMLGGFGATWALVAVRALFASAKGGA